MKLLITGGGGYLGSGLLVGLPNKYNIICLDYGPRYPLLKKIIKDNVKLIEGDITDINLLNKIMKKGVDTIIHLAGYVGNDACMTNPSKAVMTNIYGTHLLLQSSLKNHVKHFIFASTQSVYSTFKARSTRLSETTGLEPDDLYGSTKAVAEYEIRDSPQKYTILRFANIYGVIKGIKGIQKSGAIEKFIKASFEGSDITIFGIGKQKIDYIHIKDVSRCIEMIIENSLIKNKIYNVGSGKPHSIKEIAEIISDYSEKLYNHKTRIKKKTAPKNKIWPDRLMSIEKIKRELKWRPTISLKEGIYEMMENMR
jgi:nucleoside-diphosphate-sugar epimerase